MINKCYILRSSKYFRVSKHKMFHFSFEVETTVSTVLVNTTEVTILGKLFLFACVKVILFLKKKKTSSCDSFLFNP